MARIVLGIGTSHTPMLNCGVDEWQRFIERDSLRAHLDKEGRPASYADLLRNADPRMGELIRRDRLEARHAAAAAAMQRIRDTLKAARLDTLIVVGDDQNELYHEDNLPSVLIYRGETIRNVPLRGGAGPQWSVRASARYYEEASPRDYPVDLALAMHLIRELMEREFDVASAKSLPDGQGEGHAFGFVHKRLMQDNVLPVVPVFLNTYYPPNQPTPRRCYRLGQAIRAAVEAYPGEARIGVLASGGLSHFTVDEALDGEVLRALKEKDAPALQSLPKHKLNSGSSEIRNWICAGGALEHLPLTWSEYQPGYRTPAGTGTGLAFATWS